MNRFVLLFLFINTLGQSQVPDSVLEKIRMNHTSYTGLRKILSDDLYAGWSWTHYPFFATRHMQFEINSTHDASLFIKKNKVLYFSITDTKNEKAGRDKIGTDTLFMYMNIKFSSRQLKKQNKKYNTNLTLNSIYEGYPVVYEPRGSAMSFLSEYPSSEMKKIFEAVINKNLDLLINYRASFSTELQAYGAAGLYIWDKQVAPLEKRVQKFLQKSRQSSRKIIYSDGSCFIETKTLSFVLSDALMKDVLELFLEYKQIQKKSQQRLPQGTLCSAFVDVE